MSDELVLYTNPMSRGRIARWMMEEVDQPYRVEIIQWGHKSPEFMAINPMGKVPTLTHGDVVVTEAAAICAYMADAFPEAGLAPPPGDTGRAAYYRWLFFAAGPLESAVTNRTLKVQVTDEQRGMVGYGSYEQTLDALEHAIGDRTYLAGDRFSAADVYVGSQIGWGLMFGSIEKRPTFERYHAGLIDRPAFRRATELDDALMPPRPAA